MCESSGLHCRAWIKKEAISSVQGEDLRYWNYQLGMSWTCPSSVGWWGFWSKLSGMSYEIRIRVWDQTKWIMKGAHPKNAITGTMGSLFNQLLGKSVCLYQMHTNQLHYEEYGLLQSKLIEWSLGALIELIALCRPVAHNFLWGKELTCKLIHTVVQKTDFPILEDWMWAVRQRWGLDSIMCSKALILGSKNI